MRLIQHVDVVVDLKRERFIQHCNKKTKLQNTVSQTQTFHSVCQKHTFVRKWDPVVAKGQAVLVVVVVVLLLRRRLVVVTGTEEEEF